MMRRGPTLQGFASFATTGRRSLRPIHSDAAYLITWIPARAAVPPFAIRLDVIEPAKE
jgi:hypothetical protein